MTTRALTEHAQALLVRAKARRLANELDALRELAGANRGRMSLVDISRIGESVCGLVVELRPRTSVGEQKHEAIRTETVHAFFAIGRYPDTAPRIALSSQVPLFLPAVSTMALVEDFYPEYRSAVCLFRSFDRREMTLSWLVCQLWDALTAEPSVLNAPSDAMNPDAADWFVEHREQLRLPLEPPLVVPPACRPGPSHPRLVQRAE
jgi:hypothetical protein